MKTAYRDSTTLTELKDKAAKFLVDTGTTLIAEYKEKALLPLEHTEQFIYGVILERDGYKFRFDYAGDNEGLPEPAELFCFLTLHDPGTFYEWCENSGENKDSIEAKKAWKQRLREFKNLERMYSLKEMEYLKEHF